MIVYAGVVIVANIQLFDNLSVYNFWGELLIALSIGSFFLAFYLENITLAIPDIFGIFKPVMAHPVTYSSLMFCALSIYTIDIIVDTCEKALHALYEAKEVKVKEEEVNYYLFEHPALEKKPTRYYGYAYSEEFGNIPQIQEKLIKESLKRSETFNKAQEKQ